MSATIPERVAKGAAFLDEHDPGWWRADVDRAIDLDRLNLEYGDLCILGQRCPISRLAAFVEVPPSELGDEDFELAYVAMALALGAELDTDPGAGTRVDGWGVPFGFQAADVRLTGFQVNDDYRALTAEWIRVITERRSGR